MKFTKFEKQIIDENFSIAKKQVRQTCHMFNVDDRINVKLNNQLTTCLAYFNPFPIEIDFATKDILLLDYYDILRLAAHEALHYCLFVEGKEYHDGDKTFENYAKKYGLMSDVYPEGYFEFSPEQLDWREKIERRNQRKRYLYEVQCTKCGRFIGGNDAPLEFTIREAMDNINHCVCPQCNQKLRKVRILLED